MKTHILSLAEHSCSHQFISILSTNEFSSSEEDSCSIVPRKTLPAVFGSKSPIDRIIQYLLICFVVRAKMIRMIPWQRLLGEFPRFDL